jgi:mRNA interferase MazF
MPIVDGRIPEAGDVFWIDFGEPRGHEQAGRRPALVLTASEYNERSSVFVVCPIASRAKSWPFHVLLPPAGRITGFVLVDQIQAVDPVARPCKFAGTVPAALLVEVRRRLEALLEIRSNR